MILAGAGTGKTTTLLNRISHLIHNENIPPENILLLTFTLFGEKSMKETQKATFGSGCLVEFSSIALNRSAININFAIFAKFRRCLYR